MDNSVTIAGQALGFEGIPNARELGGYVMSDGLRVKRRTLIRCGSLSGATADDIDMLSSFGLRYVFDYRTTGEQTHRPDVRIPGVEYISLPCIDPEKDAMIGSQFSRKVGRPGFEDFLVDYAFTDEAKHLAASMYRTLVLSEYTQLQYGTFLNFAARDEDGAILWHCSQGKDRTGLGAAFILSALGASRELVIADFDLTNQVYRPLIESVMSRVEAKGGGKEETDVVRSFLGANTERFVEALDTIDFNFGSMEQYITDQLCLSREEISTLKKRYLE